MVTLPVDAGVFSGGPCLILRVLIDVIPVFIQENRGSERLGHASQTALNKPSPGCWVSHRPDVTALSFGHISFPPCHIPSWHWLRDVVIAWDLVQFPERNSVAELESSYIIEKLLILLSFLFAFFFFLKSLGSISYPAHLTVLHFSRDSR